MPGPVYGPPPAGPSVAFVDVTPASQVTQEDVPGVLTCTSNPKLLGGAADAHVTSAVLVVPGSVCTSIGTLILPVPTLAAETRSVAAPPTARC